MKTATVHTRNITPELHANFKAYCARRGYSMQNAVMSLMEMAVKDNIPLRKASQGARRGRSRPT